MRMIVVLLLALLGAPVAQQKPAAPTSPRLYILDCGTIVDMNPASYDLKIEVWSGRQ